MRHSIITTALFVLPCTSGLYTQKIMPATGADATGYIIAQVAYSTNTGFNGAVVQSVN